MTRPQVRECESHVGCVVVTYWRKRPHQHWFLAAKHYTVSMLDGD